MFCNDILQDKIKNFGNVVISENVKKTSVNCQSAIFKKLYLKYIDFSLLYLIDLYVFNTFQFYDVSEKDMIGHMQSFSDDYMYTQFVKNELHKDKSNKSVYLQAKTQIYEQVVDSTFLDNQTLSNTDFKANLIKNCQKYLSPLHLR